MEKPSFEELEFFREELVNTRMDLGLNLREFAPLLNISYSYLSRLETGDRNPSKKTLNVLISKLKEIEKDTF